MQAVDPDRGEREEFLSFSNRAMADVRGVIASVTGGERDGLLARLSINEGELVEPAECTYLASRLRSLDRGAIVTGTPEPVELLGFIDEFVEFCDRCAALGGFGVW